MKLLKLMKDGGPQSRVWGYWLVEIKSAFSVVLLNFKNGSREAFHNHAFNAIKWLFKGELYERELNGTVRVHKPSIIPIWTPRERFHMVTSIGDTWALSFRGPWLSRWNEYLPDLDRLITLTHGRQVVG